MTRIRVAFDARDLAAPAQRGIVRYIVGLARHLPAFGVDVTLFHRKREPLNPTHLEGLDCNVLGLRDCSVVFWEQAAVPAALIRNGFHLYHAVAERGIPLLASCPVAFTLHSATVASYQEYVRRGELPGPVSRYLGFDPDRGKWRWPVLYARLQKLRPDHTFTVSEFSRKELIRLLGFRPKRLSVVPLALPELFQRQNDLSAVVATRKKFALDAPYILNVGGFEPHKNMSGLLETFSIVRQRRPDLAMAIVGTGRVPQIVIDAAVNLNLMPGKDIHFLTNLGEELVNIYDGAEVFLSMSWRESFGVPSLEAMARGVPVVVSRWGAAPEVVNDAGQLVDPRDPRAAAAAVFRSLQSTSRETASARGRERIGHFSWHRAAQLTASVYRKLIGLHV